MKVAVLGLGEAGAIYAAGFAASGATVAGYDPADSPTPEGVHRAETVADAVSGAHLVISLATAAHAVEIAASAAPHLDATALYADLNSASPQRKQEIASALGDAARRYVDVAVIGSVPQFGPQAALTVSGPVAEEAAELFRIIGATVDTIGDEPGAASRRKILRTVFMKSLGAAITEAMDAGHAAGETDWVSEQISAALVGGNNAVDRINLGTRTHARRRASESEVAAELVASLGISPVVTTAAASRHHALSLEHSGGLAELIETYTHMPTAAIGDARDRLGVVHPRVRSVWPDAHVAGRAMTVMCRPGDNKGIHQALAEAAPGDILVVDGGGDPSRALVGELIAHRAINRGIRGMVIDGAVRDVGALHAAGFPVWAVGTSPAGPYKSGPYRIGADIAVGGAVVHRGDIVVADADGVIVVPLAEADSTLIGARAVLDDEASRHQAILSERSG